MMTLLILLLISLNVADVLTTYKILKNGGSELNKSVKLLISKFGLLYGLIASKIIILPIVAIELYYKPMVLDYVIVLLICAWYAWVVYHNIREL